MLIIGISVLFLASIIMLIMGGILEESSFDLKESIDDELKDL